MVKSFPLQLDTNCEDRIVNITKLVNETVSSCGMQAGMFTVFVKHTTASVMIIEDEEGIRKDTLATWEELVPSESRWQHNSLNAGETNGHSHLRGQTQGHSITVPFNDGKPTLGRWQEIVVIDFDTSPRTRDIIIQIVGE